MRNGALCLILLAGIGCSKTETPRAALPAVAAPAALQPGMARDPICGKIVIAAQMPRETINGTLYYFCSEQCEERAKARAGRPTGSSPDVYTENATR